VAAPLTGAFTASGLRAKTGTKLRVPFTISADTSVSLTMKRRSTTVTRSADATAGSNAVRLALRAKGKPVPAGKYRLVLRASDGSVLARTTVVVRRA
jgi:hypothetical protein